MSDLDSQEEPVRVAWADFHADPRGVARRTREAARVVVHDGNEVLFEIVRQTDDLAEWHL